MAEYSSTVSTRPGSAVSEHSRKTPLPVNVGETERWLSLIGGGALALYSLRRSLGTLGLMLLGGALVGRGLTGHCMLYSSMGISSADQHASNGND